MKTKQIITTRKMDIYTPLPHRKFVKCSRDKHTIGITTSVLQRDNWKGVTTSHT